MLERSGLVFVGFCAGKLVAHLHAIAGLESHH
jgi:hypothetical protein